jgi:hypothetical protein
VIKLYEPSPTPCLYVADVQNMVGRVPLIPLFLAGNLTPTIPPCADLSESKAQQAEATEPLNFFLVHLKLVAQDTAIDAI